MIEAFQSFVESYWSFILVIVFQGYLIFRFMKNERSIMAAWRETLNDYSSQTKELCDKIFELKDELEKEKQK